MAQAAIEKSNWEKTKSADAARLQKSGGRWKFTIGGLLILAAVAYLIVSTTLSTGNYFITVDEVVNNPQEYIGKTVRLSGAVIGETIVYDSENLELEFTISHIPTEFDNLADALRESVLNPNSSRLPVYIDNEVMPDLLQHEAQAILTGTLRNDGVFHATELLLKCPSRMEDGSAGNVLGESHPPVGANSG